MPYIKRPIYYKQIEPFIGDSLIKVIVGQRRVGKSNLLLQVKDEIIHRNPKIKTIYINKEDYQFDFIKDYHDLMNFVESNVKSKSKNSTFH